MAAGVLTCSCGLKLKTPGAVPGRVGKCPRCGSMLKVPDAPTVVIDDPPPITTRKTFAGNPVPRQKRRRPEPGGQRLGIFSPPVTLETRFVDSLGYPFWNSTGISILIFMPPALWITTAMVLAVMPMLRSNLGFSLIGVVLLTPVLLLSLAVIGYILLFLGQVFVTSALGELNQPRPPGWELGEIARGLSRWFWALLIGGVIGFMPPLIYWIYCGEVDLLDRIVLFDLIAPGMAYAQMALLACLMYDSPLAANPVTVIRAILRVGWPYFMPCLLTGVTMLVLGMLFSTMLSITEPFAQTFACWAFWVVALYAVMVLLRRIGLFCYKHAVILEWFPER